MICPRQKQITSKSGLQIFQNKANSYLIENHNFTHSLYSVFLGYAAWFIWITWGFLRWYHIFLHRTMKAKSLHRLVTITHIHALFQLILNTFYLEKHWVVRIDQYEFSWVSYDNSKIMTLANAFEWNEKTLWYLFLKNIKFIVDTSFWWWLCLSFASSKMQSPNHIWFCYRKGKPQHILLPFIYF